MTPAGGVVGWDTGGFPMTTPTLADLTAAALQLPEADRAALADALLDSLPDASRRPTRPTTTRSTPPNSNSGWMTCGAAG